MWIRLLEKSIDRKKAEITFNPHLFDRKEHWNLDLDKIEETVRSGKVSENKCEKPNKLCLKRYFGKENITYTVIVRHHRNFIEVKTVSLQKGRRFNENIAEENVTRDKIKKLSRVIQVYANSQKIDKWQFDVCAVHVFLDEKKANIRFLENQLLPE